MNLSTELASGDAAEFRRLPFDHCALSFQPFEFPLCNQDGVIYDQASIYRFIKQHGIDPASGKKMDRSALIKLNFAKNNDGKYHCPVLFKVFNENSHIVAIRTTGNVFSYEAVEQLNLKTKNFKDLLDDTPFTRADIIQLQDPQNLQKFNLNTYFHVKNNLKADQGNADKNDSRRNLKHVNNVTRSVLDKLDKEYKAPVSSDSTSQAGPSRDKFNAAHFSTGTAAASFTSTAMTPSTKVEAAVLADDVVRYSMVKKKGYVQLATSHGNINLELFCDVVPKTCENFIGLSAKGYYDGTIFHRSIRNFILQGGDPTGTGTGGDSLWAGPSRTNFMPISYTKVAACSAWRIPEPIRTNVNCRFLFLIRPSRLMMDFITYRSCRHLDKKHTVFGKVVGGLPTLQAIEDIETDNKDRPIEDVRLIKATVFVNPFEEADEELAKLRETNQQAEQQAAKREKILEERKRDKKVFTAGVGKYINPELKRKIAEKAVPSSSQVISQKKPKPSFDFSKW
ncbi:RING-type E3 ubiquitin-protein ligase PPIL2 [Galendromus occidentalis]|uniref:RING-type E3 ubiquitin transferase n=1 Tax=Galendromus occidentalis TaxID=34638 RepID=A0AAJ7SJT9_9ACAR|nr:RING-type E3 ubiquitin-protein ligase PPIL2 [Galendromus occidentalis]